MSEEQAERLIKALNDIHKSIFLLLLALGVIAGTVIGTH